MASYHYAVMIQKPGQDETEIHEGASPWTHDTATSWARSVGDLQPAGSVIRIWRWQVRAGDDAQGCHPRRDRDATGRILWARGDQHRAYLVERDGIVRRTDR